jgi:hypothetical protein
MPVLQHGWAAIAPEINQSGEQRESIPSAEVVNGSVNFGAFAASISVQSAEPCGRWSKTGRDDNHAVRCECPV